MIKRILTGCFLLSTSYFASADCNEIICTGELNKLSPNSNGSIYISFSEDMTPLNCDMAAGKYITLKDTNPRHGEIYSMLLASIISKKNVSIRISEGTDGCAIYYTYMTNE